MSKKSTSRYALGHPEFRGHSHGRKCQRTVPRITPIRVTGGSSARLILSARGLWATWLQSGMVLWQRPRPGEPKKAMTGLNTIGELTETAVTFGWNRFQASHPHQHYPD
jgi:hypothetical protein